MENDLKDFTVFELLDEARRRIDDRCYAAGLDVRKLEITRDLDLARTAIEDAQMRHTRALARELEIFNPADLERS